MDRERLLVFVRHPREGRVKTRLARTMGGRLAATLYGCLVADTLGAARRAGHRPLVFFCPPSEGPAVARWLGDDLSYAPQEGRSLGDRMKAAFERAFHECSRAVLIGSDIPELTPAVLDEAFASLDSHDAVIGPAADGGYYLIGFTSAAFFPGVFRGMHWGDQSVLDSTTGMLKRRGVSFHTLPALSDIDDCVDVAAFFERWKDLPECGLSTIELLRASRVV